MFPVCAVPSPIFYKTFTQPLQRPFATFCDIVTGSGDWDVDIFGGGGRRSTIQQSHISVGLAAAQVSRLNVGTDSLVLTP